MKLDYIILIIIAIMNGTTLFDFNPKADISNWQIINDGVMGGLSKGNFRLNEQGHGLFTGKISLDNNGGFSSVRCRYDNIDVSNYKEFTIRLKGDGKKYQFRTKSTNNQQYSYISQIETTGEWQTVTIKFANMYPAFRGRVLDLPNYSGDSLGEIAFLIGNKKEENFALQLDYIKIK